MARFLALYIGSASNDKQTNQPSAATQEMGMAAWAQWATEHQASIVDGGAPLGKTVKVDQSGISNITNLITGYVTIEAENHDELLQFSEAIHTSKSSLRPTQSR